MRKKSWQEKLNSKKDLPKIVALDGKQRERYGDGLMLVPSPIDVDNIMKKVPKGKLITINEIRKVLAYKYNATITCPLTTGIFVWISANAAKEMQDEGKKRITPYWRTLKSGGYLNEKYPGGVEAHKRLLEEEGYKVIKKGKRYMVEDWDKHIVNVKRYIK